MPVGTSGRRAPGRASARCRCHRRVPGAGPRLAIELVALFGLPPAAMFALRDVGVRVPVVPVILCALLICAVLAFADRTFGLGAIGLVGVTAVAAPAELFRLPFERTGLWLAILVYYPLLSVLPQELVFRAFFFHRYRALFDGERALWIGSALTFGSVHAPFGWTWMRTRSLALVSVEHALHGCFVFTVGLRAYFQGRA